ncbi:MAG: AI-2E family transporter [Lachnospiraceae bacterium]|nr:AI-2E family transporter [Lachnospiraceae bacterium]
MDEEKTQEPQEEEKKKEGGLKPDRKTLFSIGLMIFLTFFACNIVFFLFYRYDGFTDGWNNLLMVLQPVLFGIVGAYLVNPIMKAYEAKMLPYFLKKSKNEVRTKRHVRNVSITLGLITFLAIVSLVILIIIPQMISNISDLTKSVPKEIAQATDWMEANSDSTVVSWFSERLNDLAESFVALLKGISFDKGFSYITSVASGVYIVIRSIINLIIGLIVAVYLLQTKEAFIGQGKKIVYALFKPETGNKIIHVMRRSNEIFGGFVIGKIIDSLIIGVISFITLRIMQLPYPALLATIIGVTNIIPIFGPFIGAIPCLILVVLANPLQALYLLIFIIVLQQVDGNIIGPKILGDSTGLSSFWVIFSILVAGGFFGLPGMILGVPVFAVIYYLLKRFFEGKLRKRELPTKTKDYVRAVKMDVDTHQLRYPEDLDEQEIAAEQEGKVQRTGLFRLGNFKKKKK